jgi:hypothetical protein
MGLLAVFDGARLAALGHGVRCSAQAWCCCAPPGGASPAPTGSDSRAAYRNIPGRAPSVEPAVLPSDEKKPLGLEAFARTLRSCDGMPRVRHRRFESTP